jgi:hypothetical protein
MWKKVMLLAIGILAVVALAAGTMTTVNAADNKAGDTAQGAPPPGGHPGRPGGPGGPGFGGPGDQGSLDRVAQILGIDKQKLADAFKQAGTELAQKRTGDMFAKLVTDGKLTQAQADQYKAWLTAKPAGVPGFGFGDATREGNTMSSLLKDGKITQAQYDAWKAWIAQKPNFDLPKPGRPAGAAPHKVPQTTK